MKPNLSARLVNVREADVVCLLHTDRAPSRAEWSEAIALANDYAIRGDVRRLRVLAITDGGGPDHEMREEAVRFYRTHHFIPKVAVLLTSVFARGITAAVSLFNPNVRAFSPRQFTEALTHLELPLSSRPRLLKEAADMERLLGPNGCLSLING